MSLLPGLLHGKAGACAQLLLSLTGVVSLGCVIWMLKGEPDLNSVSYPSACDYDQLIYYGVCIHCTFKGDLYEYYYWKAI